MLKPSYELSEAGCAIAAAKGYAARVTAQHQRNQRKEQSTQTEEQQSTNIVPSRSEGVQAEVEKGEVPFSRKATAAAKRTLTEGEAAPCLRKATHPVKPGKSLQLLGELAVEEVSTVFSLHPT